MAEPMPVDHLLHVRKVVDDEVRCPPFEFQVREEYGPGLAVVLYAKLWRKDVDTGMEGWGYGPPILIHSNASDAFIVKRCLVAALSYAEHEVREAFLWKGRRIFGPHVSLDVLWEVAP